MYRPQPRYKKGDQIGGRYLVHKALMGGMGEVYLCLDTEDMLPFALKTFQQRYFADTGLKRRFETEVRSWIALENHPNIVRCHYMQSVDNTPFMFLEWVAGHESKGTSLRQWLRRGPLDLKTALTITIGILRGLRHADAKSPGIVHRDLKPDNILLTQDGTAKITDLGLAIEVSETPGLSLDARNTDGGFVGSMLNGEVVGTPSYMPPEQWRGEKVDLRADMYAVGCILYEMLTGELAFSTPKDVTTHSEFMRIMQELHQSTERTPLPSELPRELNRLMLACLHPDLNLRPKSVTNVLDNVTEIYEDITGKPPPVEPQIEALKATDYSNRGATFYSLNEYARAFADFHTAICLDPNDGSVYYNRGLCYAALDEHDQAIYDFDAAIRHDPQYAPAYYSRGKSYGKKSEHQSAIDDFDQAIRLDPDFTDAYNNRGTSNAALGQHDRAIEDYGTAIRLDPDFAGTYNNRGMSYAALGQHDQAIQDFEEAIRLDPSLTIAYFHRGVSYAALGQHDQAIQDFEEAIRLDPNLATAFSNRGASYGEMGEYERSITDFDQAISLAPDYTEAYYNRGLDYATIGQHDRAIQNFDSAIHLDPSLAIAYSNRGACYAELGHYGRAIEDYEEVIRLDPNHVSAYNNLGTSYAKLGQHERAIENYNMAIQVDPTLVPAYYNRGNSYGELGNRERAIVDYDEAIQLDPDFSPAYLSKGAELANNGQLVEALPCFERAGRLGDPNGFLNAARVRQILGPVLAHPNPNDHQAAFEAFRRAESLDEMRQAVGQFPVLAQMIPTIQQVINEQVPPEHHPAFEQKLAWLQQIVGNE